jgi:diaminopimelate epimerase
MNRPLTLNIVRADPAGNITIFVLDQIEDPRLRLDLAKALLAEPSLKAEQVGFVSPPGYPAGRKSPRWRLEMMGGEFCGNAARSFGLYVAREAAAGGAAQGGTGDGRVAQTAAGGTGDRWAPQAGAASAAWTTTIEISGAAEPLDVQVSWPLELPAASPGASAAVTGTAQVNIPPPLGGDTLALGGRNFPMYFFEGITHVIAEGLSPDRDLVFQLLEGARHPAAFGVMFYEPGQRFLRPAVYVEATGSLVFESSCGSGTAALMAWLAKYKFDSDDCWAIAQPGGVIEGRVKKQAGEITAISIGGPVTLSPRRSITVL